MEGMPRVADGAMAASVGDAGHRRNENIEIHTSSAERAVIGALILLCFGGGAALLRKIKNLRSALNSLRYCFFFGSMFILL